MADRYIWANHPVLTRIVCLAESLRQMEKALERNPSIEITSLYANRRLLDTELAEWRKAISDDPSAFVITEEEPFPKPPEMRLCGRCFRTMEGE